jgi:hypothetical protein
MPLDPSLRILQTSASFLSLHNLTAGECSGVGIYELVEIKGLVPEAASVRHAIETAQVTKKVYATERIQLWVIGLQRPDAGLYALSQSLIRKPFFTFH